MRVDYIVTRPFSDAIGRLNPGDVPTPDRIATWKNLEALIGLGMVLRKESRDEPLSLLDPDAPVRARGKK